MKKIIIIVISILLLCWCDKNDNKKCIKSHEETRTCVRPQCVFMGKNPICINQFYNCEQKICDEYNLEKEEEK